jgi:biotin-(acetyl-CoA carboxylase) ligase
VTAGVEWPNDVTVRTAGREEPAKVAGVLVETRRAAGRRRMVVGFGVNVTAAPPPTGLRRPAAALADAAGWAIERIDLLRCILVRLDEWLGLLETGHAGLLHERWVARCDMLGRRLSVRSDGRVVTGRVLDVSPLEGLALMTDDGRRLHLPAVRSTLEV